MSSVLFALTGDAASNSRAVRQVRALARNGYDVTVVHFRRGNEPLPDGVAEVALDIPGHRGPRFFREIHRRVGVAVDRIDAAVYHSSDLYVLRALHTAAKRNGSRLVFDSRELYTDVAGTNGKPWARWYWHRLQKKLLPDCDLVFTVSDGIADRLERKYGILRPTVVHNVPEISVSTESAAGERDFRSVLGISPDALVVLHLGQMRKHRGLYTLLGAASRVDLVHLVFLGSGEEKDGVEKRAHRLGMGGRVHFMNPVPPAEVVAWTASADLGVTLLEATCLNHLLALPNKLFEYLAASVPVVASDFPEMARIVTGYGVGATVDPADEGALAAVFRDCLENRAILDDWICNMDAAGETYCWARASHEFLSAYNSVAR